MTVFRSHLKSSGKLWLKFLRQSVGPPRPHLLYVGGFHGHGNLGDEALLASTRRAFAHASLVEFPVRCRPQPMRLFYPEGQPSVLAGGTLINRDLGWLATVKEYSRTGKSFSVFGTGVASRAFWEARGEWEDQMAEWVPILRSCRYVGVRGPLSAQALQAEGIRAEVLGDPALVLADDTPSRRPEGVQPSLGLSLATKGEMWGDKHDVQARVAALARRAHEAGWQVHWFVLHRTDLAPTRRQAELTRTDGFIHEIYDDYTEYMDLVRPLSAFAGMKLHAVVLAICTYVPAIMLEYRPKCRDFMLSIAQGNASFRADRFDPNEIWEILRSWQSGRSEKSTELYELVQAARGRLRQKALELVPPR